MSIPLGPCCGCRTLKGVNAVVMLSKRCLVPGHGWGCFQCGLSSDGASVVLCDPCADRFQAGEPLSQIASEACRGYPATEGRAPLAAFTDEFRHDMSKHPEAEPGDSG